MGNQTNKTNETISAAKTLINRNTSSMRGPHLLKAHKKHDTISRQWSFSNYSAAMAKFSSLEGKINQCSSILSIVDLKHMLTNNGEHLVAIKMQYPSLTLQQQIIERKRQYRTFDQKTLWECLESLTIAIHHLRQFHNNYFPDSLSEIFMTDSKLKIKDPELLPTIRNYHFSSFSQDCIQIAKVIISMGILSETQEIKFSDLNLMNLRYSTKLATLLHRMHEGTMTIKEVILEANTDYRMKNIAQTLKSSLIIDGSRETVGKISEKTSFGNITEYAKKDNEKEEQKNKQNIKPNIYKPNLLRIEQIKPKKMKINDQNKFRQNSSDGETRFPKKIKVLQKSSLSSSIITMSKYQKQEKYFSEDFEKDQLVSQNFKNIEDIPQEEKHVLNSKSQQSLFESIIQQNSSPSLKNDGSPVSALVDELDFITGGFRQEEQIEIRSRQFYQRGFQMNSTIIQVTEEDEHSYTDENNCFQSQEKNIIEEYEGGSKYEGQVLNKKKHGYGKLFYSDGGFYEGQWIQNKMSGYGKLYNSNHNLIYEGYWKQGEFDGIGMIVNQTPQQISDDEFDFRDFSGVGKRWLSYEGNFKHDQKSGKGTLILSNGEKLVANWDKNQVQGKGLFFTKKKQIQGLWHQDQLKSIF